MLHDIAPQQLGRGPVGQLDLALVVEADHAGGDTGQHQLGEAPAVVQLLVGRDQLDLLGLQSQGHGVEGAAELAQLVVALAGLDAGRQVAAAQALGRSTRRRIGFTRLVAE
jgi:hypothetical protein